MKKTESIHPQVFNTGEGQGFNQIEICLTCLWDIGLYHTSIDFSFDSSGSICLWMLNVDESGVKFAFSDSLFFNILVIA